MKPSRRRRAVKIVGILGALFLAGSGATGLSLYLAWTHRDDITAAVANELHADHLTLASLHFDPHPGIIDAEFTDVRIAGQSIDRVLVAVDSLASLRNGHAELRGITASGLQLSDAIGASGPDEGAALPDFSTAAAILARLGKIKIKQARISLERSGLPLPLFIDDAEIRAEKDGAFALQIRGRLLDGKRSAGAPVTIRGQVFLSKENVEIRALEFAARDLQLPAFYIHYLDPEAALPAALPLHYLSAEGGLHFGASGIKINLTHATVDSPLAVATAAVFVEKSGPNFQYRVDAEIGAGTTAVLKALPPSLIGPAINQWLAANLKQAYVSHGSLHLSGDESGAREMQLHLPLKDGTLAFAPGWPEISALEADVDISLAGLHAVGTHALLDRLEVKRFQIDVPNFHDRPILTASIALASNAKDALRFLAATPLAPEANDVAKWPVAIDGPFHGELVVTAALDGGAAFPPPAAGDSVDVRGKLSLDGVQLVPRELNLPPILDIRGPLEFTTKSFNLPAASARFDGAPADLSTAANFSPGQFKVKFKGDAFTRAETIMSALGRPDDQHLAGRAATKFYGEMVLAAAQNGGLRYEAHANVDLTDLKIDLPVLMQKGRGAPSYAELEFKGGDEQNAWQLSSPALQARAEWNSGDGQFAESFGAVIARSKQALPSIKPGTIALSLPNAEGTILLPSPSEDRLHVKLSRLFIVTAEDSSANERSGTQQAQNISPKVELIDPRTLPPITFVCDEMIVGARRLGKVELVTSKTKDGQAVDHLAINFGSASVYDAKGAWRMTPFGTDFSMDAAIYLRNGGRALETLGIARGVDGLQGNGNIALSWPNISTKFDITNLTVNLGASLANGRVEIEAGLGLTALEILTLDFSELTETGLEIESAKLAVKLQDGIVTVTDATVESPSTTLAHVKGKIDTASGKVDAKGDVTLKISRTLNAVALGVVNPLLALGFLSQGDDFTVVKLDRFTRRSYHVSGDIKDPKIELVAAATAH